jgi:hypothetical protein
MKIELKDKLYEELMKTADKTLHFENLSLRARICAVEDKLKKYEKKFDCLQQRLSTFTSNLDNYLEREDDEEDEDS